MIKSLLFRVFTSNTPAVAVTPEDSAKAQALYERGETYAKEGEYNKAIKDFEAVLEIDPNNTDAKELLEKNIDKFIESLSADIKIKPSYPYYSYFVLGERGRMYYKKGNYDKAIEDFKVALKTAPFCSALINSRISIIKSLEKSRNKFIESLSADIKIKPNDIKVLANRGYQYANIGKYDKAIKDFNVALKINPDEQYIIFNRGLVYAYKGNYGKAIKDFEAVLKINPNNKGAKKILEIFRPAKARAK